MDIMDDMQRGARLRELRLAARLTGREVGAHFGIDKSAISEWERGKSRPTMDKVVPLDKLYRAEGEVIELLIHDGTTGQTALESLRDVVKELAEIQRGLSVRVGELADEIAELTRRSGPGSRGSRPASP